MRYLRRELLEVRGGDDFLWLLRWLKKAKNWAPALYEEVTRTAAMRRKLEALGAGTRYLSLSQKMSRAIDRRRRDRGQGREITRGDPRRSEAN
jgi:hypothetical protein